MKNKILVVATLLLLLFVVGCGKRYKENVKEQPIELPSDKSEGFNISLIKKTKTNSNYLISPYSIRIALNMLKEGANNNTKSEIEKIVDGEVIEIATNDRVKIANALFIKDVYKDKIKEDFSNSLINNYNSNLLYDSFITPDVINNWVYKNTDGMIKKILDSMDDYFVFGLANAVAIDVEWTSEFECIKTTNEEFTKIDNQKINVEMMHNDYKSDKYKYLESSNAKGIIIPYKSYDGVNNLEFVGILPNSDVNSYVDNLTEEELKELFKSAKPASQEYEIILSLPRFKYTYEIPNLKVVLSNMGIKDAFNPNMADFTNVMNRNDMNGNVYVSDAIHKTYIDLNEKGTKAAAVTYFGTRNTSIMRPKDIEKVIVKFNKPFVYMIRDTKTEEILFFGIVFTPNSWNGSTCS